MEEGVEEKMVVGEDEKPVLVSSEITVVRGQGSPVMRVCAKVVVDIPNPQVGTDILIGVCAAEGEQLDLSPRVFVDVMPFKDDAEESAG
jgi:hypothetical protein